MNLNRVNEQTSPDRRYLRVIEKKNLSAKKISRQWQHVS